jgi:hypothetical protein
MQLFSLFFCPVRFVVHDNTLDTISAILFPERGYLHLSWMLSSSSDPSICPFAMPPYLSSIVRNAQQSRPANYASENKQSFTTGRIISDVAVLTEKRLMRASSLVATGPSVGASSRYSIELVLHRLIFSLNFFTVYGIATPNLSFLHKF